MRASALTLAAALVATASPAQAYDMDCKLILCLAGGFPAGCADAKAYMIDRITSVPPKPPIGFCAMSDGSEYADYSLVYRWIDAASSAAWICPPGKEKFFRASPGDQGETNVTVFCYDEKTRIFASHRAGGPSWIYSGRSVPERVDFSISITLSPGASDEWFSDVQHVRTEIPRGNGIVYVTH